MPNAINNLQRSYRNRGEGGANHILNAKLLLQVRRASLSVLPPIGEDTVPQRRASYALIRYHRSSVNPARKSTLFAGATRKGL
jgi:hypothetical protein